MRLRLRLAGSSIALLVASALAQASSAVTDLGFRDIFRLPVGPRGLELAPGLQGLAGQRVRLAGYMVQQDAGTGAPGVFILAPLPVALDDEDETYADDLPPNAVHVHLPPSQAARTPAHLPGRLMLTGTLEVGARDEADGRRSFVRLRLDEPLAETKEKTNAPTR